MIDQITSAWLPGKLFSVILKSLGWGPKSSESSGHSAHGNKSKKEITKKVRQGKVVRVTGHESSDDNESEDEVDEKALLRRVKSAEKLVKRKEYKEAKDIYENILSKNGHRALASDPNLTTKDKYHIIRCSLGKAKCHFRLCEYRETISTINKCIVLMKESSKYNKVHVYQRLGAAYLMLMEYRASLLVCLYGLTQFSKDEKLLAIQNYILSRYEPTSDAVKCWLEDATSFRLGGKVEESNLCNETLIEMCNNLQKYQTDVDSNQNYIKPLSTIIHQLDAEHPVETNGPIQKEYETQPGVNLDGKLAIGENAARLIAAASGNHPITPDKTTLASVEKACGYFRNEQYSDAILEFEVALKSSNDTYSWGIQYGLSRCCFLTSIPENLLKGLNILEKMENDVSGFQNGENKNNGKLSANAMKVGSEIIPAIFYGLGQHNYRFKHYEKATSLLQHGMNYLNEKVKCIANDSLLIVPQPISTIFPELTSDDVAQKLIEDLLCTVKNLPKPDATCSYPNCADFRQHEYIAPQKDIYFNKEMKDIDFKGMTILRCENKCHIAYHAICWKEHKKEMDKIKHDKDFLGKECITPDCGGRVIELRIVRENGKEIKLDDENTVRKGEDKKTKPKFISSASTPTDVDYDKQTKKGQQQKEKNWEGRGSKKEKRPIEDKLVGNHESNTNERSPDILPVDPEMNSELKKQQLVKDENESTLKEELDHRQKKIDEQELQIESNRRELHDLLVRIDEHKAHSKRQAEEIKKLKNSMDKEKANLDEERNHNFRLLQLNEAKDNEVVQTKECHGKEIYELALYEAAKYHRLARFVNSHILSQSTTIGRVVWDYESYLDKIKSNPAFTSAVPSAKTFQIKGPEEPDFNCLLSEYHSHMQHEVEKAKLQGTSSDITRIATNLSSANTLTDALPQPSNVGDPVSLNLADFSVPPPNAGLCQPGRSTPVSQGNTGAIPKGFDQQEKLMQIICRIKDVYPNMTDEVALDYIMRTRQYMKKQGRKAKFPADVINYIILEDEWRQPELECAICLEEMFKHDMITLECNHKFHKKCINDWFREKHDCPQCRTHALPTDDFPALLAGNR